MRDKVQTKAFEQVASMLQPGEQPVAGTRAVVGKFGASRLGTAVKQGIAIDAGGALAALLVKNSKQFVVVTTDRLIFLSQTFMGGAGKTVLGEISRDQVTLAEAKIGVMSVLRLAFGDEGEGISLTFPAVDKRNAEALAAALRPVPAA
ncbi:hypothetical protein [Actinoplanes solisilvae]|uniref:hypothetical protein n=1 Tax=Actinoplanes solisilvae TaxID=2486853 RepID=UPI000FD8B436|nr:hypothetical protein [Actinoplanes solisilvae]